MHVGTDWIISQNKAITLHATFAVWKPNGRSILVAKLAIIAIWIYSTVIAIMSYMLRADQPDEYMPVRINIPLPGFSHINYYCAVQMLERSVISSVGVIWDRVLVLGNSCRVHLVLCPALSSQSGSHRYGPRQLVEGQNRQRRSTEARWGSSPLLHIALVSLFYSQPGVAFTLRLHPVKLSGSPFVM